MNAQRKEDLFYTSADYDTTPLHAEICTALKREAETILRELEVPVSTAIQIFYEQIIMLGKVPVDHDLSIRKPLCLDDMTPEEFDAAMQEGIDSGKSGKRYTPDDIDVMLAREFGV